LLDGDMMQDVDDGRKWPLSGFTVQRRWMPVDMPDFPARERALPRLCVGEVDGERKVLTFEPSNIDGAGDEPFYELTYDEDGDTVGHWISASGVTVVRWLSPEFTDEIPELA
jgi:hypothetical protein